MTVIALATPPATMDANMSDYLSDEPAGGELAPQDPWTQTFTPAHPYAFSNAADPQQYLLVSQGWPPSPPPLHGEEPENYSCRAPYVTASPHSAYNPSSLSPPDWPHDPSAWNDSFSMQTQPNPETADHDAFSHAKLDPADRVPRHESPAMLADSFASCSLSPSDSQYAIKDEDNDPEVVLPLTPGDDGGLDDKARSEEPYAQLIYRAFMSRPDHAMTLQEIYQWFRENTDKDKGRDKDSGKESKGWQNSIRHNLSMNGAFVKREKAVDCTLDNPPTPSEVKKSTEWVLQPWAVHGGVKSTTRYRKSDSRRGRLSPVRPSRHQTFYPHPLNPNQTIPGRARSGHKGGKAAASVKRDQMVLRQAAFLHTPPSSYPVTFDQTPEAAHSQFHFHHQLQYEYQAQGLQASHQQQQQQATLHSIPPADAALAFHQPPYDLVDGSTLADVQGVYPCDGLLDGDGMYGWCAAGYGGSPVP